MDTDKLIYRLELNDDGRLDENIEPMPANLVPLVSHQDLLLRFRMEARLLELDHQRPTIDALQKPRAQQLMNPYDPSDDSLG